MNCMLLAKQTKNTIRADFLSGRYKCRLQVADYRLQMLDHYFIDPFDSQTRMEDFMKSKLTMNNNQPLGKEEQSSLSNSKQPNTN